jgi:hypothetical protein
VITLTETAVAEPTGIPKTEGSGPEQPRPQESKAVAISVPSLPVGGGADDEEAVDQCVGVSWLGDDEITDGVSIAVTAVWITPDGVFKMNGSGCGGTPACAASFSFTSERTDCSVSVTAKAIEGASANLSLRGEARCSAEQEHQCRDLVAHETGQSIQLRQPIPPEQPPSSTDETTPSPTS